MCRGAWGFTLIEVLIVIAIIVILAAMILPVYELASRRAETTHCSANLRHLALAIGVYAEDNDSLLIPARTSAGAPAVLGTSWDVLLLPYQRSEQMYLCLSDQNPNWATGTTCYKHSYGLNLDLTMVGGYNGSALSLPEIAGPTQTILLFDLKGSTRVLGLSYAANGLSRIETRHGTGANFSFVDGHVKWLQPNDTVREGVNLWKP